MMNKKKSIFIIALIIMIAITSPIVSWSIGSELKESPIKVESTTESKPESTIEPETETPVADDDFVNIRSIDSSIIVDLVYNTPNNFTHQRIYDFAQGVLRHSTAKKLAAANSILKDHGFVIKVWDAYRPLYAQQALWDAYPDVNFVAKPDPNHIAGHQLGATVDMTLCTLDGKEALMQTPFDDFSSKAFRNYPRTEEQEKNYQIMDDAMVQSGFIGYELEWWEYRDSNQNFPPIEIDPSKV